jgi:hypothetical protein
LFTGLDTDAEFEPDVEPEMAVEAVSLVTTGLDVDCDPEPDTAPAFDPDVDVLVWAQTGVMLPEMSAIVLTTVQSLFMAFLLTGRSGCIATPAPE